MTHLLTITRRPPPANAPAVETFPFTVPAIRSLPVLDLSAPVTFFVGENGSGKSTLLEGIAAAASTPSGGGDDIGRDSRRNDLRSADPLGQVTQVTQMSG